MVAGFPKGRARKDASSPRAERRAAGYYALDDPFGERLEQFDRVSSRRGGALLRVASWLGRFMVSPFFAGAKARAQAAATEESPSGFAPQPLPDEAKQEGRWKRYWRRSVLGIKLAAFALAALIVYLAVTAPLSKSLEPIAPPQITLLAADGKPIARSGAVVARPVKVAELPPHVVHAFLAIEDRRFYEHWGVDPRGIARAAFANLTSSSVQGGSTITQQLAKFTFLSPERSLSRKLREMLIAFWLEAWLTKDEILERYLSNAYFGDNRYGLRAASLHYFYRQPENLTPAQAAMLAGLLKAPSRLAPTRNYTGARRRMQQVVAAMVEAGYLTAGQAARMRAPRLDVRARNFLPSGTYFADWVLPSARQNIEPGYEEQRLVTTLDTRLQRLAERIIARAPLGDAQAALVAMRPTGEVVAMVGGKDYAKSPFNRATQARRQPGSTFKLFVYLAALENGMDATSLIDNRPIETGSYRPRNASGRYAPQITLKDAFVQSSNVAAVRLFYKLGDETIVEQARRFGVRAPLPKGDPSLALGTANMTLLEMTAAYAGVAANRFPVEPHAFARGEPGLIARLFDGTERLSSRNHRQIEDMLRAAVNRGTGRAARLPIPNYGKTGTSQNNRDALFVGYAGDLVVGVWIGKDDNSPLDGISGGGLPARIWRDFMIGALGLKARPRAIAPTSAPNDDGARVTVEPDGRRAVIEGEGARLTVEDGAVALDTRIGDIPIRVEVDESGARLRPAPPAPPKPPQPNARR